MSTGIELSAGPAAFGDGAHPTTRGVLAALQAIDPAAFTPRMACDMGAGSGIISFAVIAKFGCSVVAADIERSAVATLHENAAQNGVAARHPGLVPGSPKAARREIPGQARDDSSYILPVHSDGFTHPEIAAHAPFDLIVMNILAEPLLKLAADAERHLAGEGVLILSGMLQWQEPQVRAAYEMLGLELTSRIVIGDWVSLVWQKPAL